MKSTFRLFLPITMLVSILLGGCAMSGGGSPVHFTPKNSQEIVLSPYYLSDPAEGADHAWYMKLKISDKKPVAGFLKPNQLLTESFTSWISSLKPVANQVISSAGAKATEGCKGSFTAQIKMLESGQFTGSLLFAEYADDCSLVLNGQVPFKGSMEMTSGAATAELSLAQLSADLADQKLQFAGTLQVTFNALKAEKQAISVESRLSLSDEAGLRMGLTPVVFTWDRRGTYAQSTMEGTLVIPPHGMVQLTTTSPLQLYPKSGHPFDGSLLFKGANDSWIRLLFPKPGAPGFFRVDGSDELETIGQL